MTRQTTVMAIEYHGVYTAKLDDKNRLKVPTEIRETMVRRNRHNFQSTDFTIKESGGLYIANYKEFPFAVIDSNRRITKSTVDMGSIDELVYVAVGRISEDGIDLIPEFMTSEPDTVFLYNATDAQHLMYGRKLKKLGFAQRHHSGIIDSQRRLQLAHIIENFETMRSIIADDNHHTNVIGQPSMNCVTLSKLT